MNQNNFFIRKVPGEKIQAIRINSWNEIPRFLRRYISVDKKNINLRFRLKETTAPLGSVVVCDYWGPYLRECSLFEKLPENIFEKNGIFYKECPVMLAAKIEEQLPPFMKNVDITYYENYYVFNTWGGVTLIEPNDEGYFCLYGYSKKDNYPLIEVIRPYSYKDYIVCDEEGNYIRNL